ncbi:MAG: hypothetical protein PHE89_03575 [Alphaproteobacteria bacterium]|nr:hypothetical protein [Alphaproteobacteria bacterium]
MFKKQTFMAEKYLMDTLDRISRNRAVMEDLSAIYVAVSRLKPRNRHPSFVNVLAHFFDGVISSSKASFFKLQNGDFIIIGENIVLQQVDEAIKKIRHGFASDPLIHKESFEDFAKIYRFPDDFEKFINCVDDAIFNINTEINVVENKPKMGLEAENYDVVFKCLERMNLSEIIRRQSCFSYSEEKGLRTLFQEFFFAVKDLNIKLSDRFDLMKNKWIFLYLSTFLDRRILSSFFTSNITKWPSYISLNLNLDSVFTKEFVDFAKRFLKTRQKIIVEVKLIDVLNNIDLYLEARDVLRRGGNKVLIDEVPLSAIEMLNFDQFDMDYIKVFWEPLLEYEQGNSKLKSAIQRIGTDKIILAKCASKVSLDWGMKYGIKNFQGPYFDTLEVNQLMGKCCDSGACSKENCMRLRKQTSNLYLEGCSSKIVFEDYL